MPFPRADLEEFLGAVREGDIPDRAKDVPQSTQAGPEGTVSMGWTLI